MRTANIRIKISQIHMDEVSAIQNGGRFDRAPPAAISYFDAKSELDWVAGSGTFDLISECRRGRGRGGG